MINAEKREKAIRGLEICGYNGYQCEDCPYYEDGNECSNNLCRDTLALLKTQEARIMTEADFENNPKVDENGNLPCWIEYRPLVGIAVPVGGWSNINKEWVEGYRGRRFWTIRPTDEQRKAVPWNG